MVERLVFVTIKNGPTLPSGRPLRRAVVPVEETTSWSDFQSVVQRKLRISSMGQFYSKKGNTISTIAEVLDADDLEVEELQSNSNDPVNSPVPTKRQVDVADLNLSSPRLDNQVTSPSSPHMHLSSARRFRSGQHAVEDGDINIAPSPSRDDDDEEANKYKPKGGMNRMLQKIGLKQPPGLPVTSDGKEGKSSAGRRRKAQGPKLSVIVFMAMLLCFGTIMLMYLRLQPGLEGSPASNAHQARPPAFGVNTAHDVGGHGFGEMEKEGI